MKNTAFAPACLIAFSAYLPATPLLFDDFDDGVVDGALWGSILPNGSSTVVESGGLLTTTARGILHSQDSFPEMLRVDCRVALRGRNEQFDVVIRTNLSDAGPGLYGARQGLQFTLSNVHQRISIQEVAPDPNVAILVNKPFQIVEGQYYNVSIRDYGYAVEFWIDGTLEATAATSYATGDRVAFFGREFSNTSSDIDSISVTQIADSDHDGLFDQYETDTGIYVSPTDTGTDPDDPDSDDDGLLDGAEVLTYGTNPNLPDTDEDGFFDGFEVGTGFDPTSKTSVPDSLSSIKTAVEFRFSAAVGESYRIEGSGNLQDWTIIENGIAGNGGEISRFYSTDGPRFKALRARKN